MQCLLSIIMNKYEKYWVVSNLSISLIIQHVIACGTIFYTIFKGKFIGGPFLLEFKFLANQMVGELCPARKITVYMGNTYKN